MAQSKGKFTPKKYLPLSEATYYILLALLEPLHGYAVMQKVEQISEGSVRLGPGTLYGAFSNLEANKLIVKVGEEGRRKSYTLTPNGKAVLIEQVNRLEIKARNGKRLTSAER